MNKIAETINSLILDSWGGLIAFWGLITALFVKLFSRLFCFFGKCLASGFTDAIVKSLMPKIIEEMDKELKPIKKALHVYKNEKHKSENELCIIRGAILHDDKEFLENYKNQYAKKTRE